MVLLPIFFFDLTGILEIAVNLLSAIIEISNHAKSNLPSLLDKEMHNYLADIDFGNNIDIHFEDGEVWWCNNQIYDSEKDQGSSFGYESQWHSLFDGNDPGDASYLYMYINVGNIKQKYKQKEYIESIVKILKQKSTMLRKSKINFINDIDYDDPYILTYPLHREFNMVTLKDRDKLRKTVQLIVKSFTSKCLAALSADNKSD